MALDFLLARETVFFWKNTMKIYFGLHRKVYGTQCLLEQKHHREWKLLCAREDEIFAVVAGNLTMKGGREERSQ